MKVSGIEDQPNDGYNIYKEDFPAPQPTTNKNGLFGQLFGIIYRDNEKKQHIQTISIYEYCKTYGYNSNFISEITKSDAIEDTLLLTLPMNTMSAIVNMTHKILNNIQQVTINRENKRLDIDLLAPVLFNGMIPTKLLDNHSWKSPYAIDKE